MSQNEEINNMYSSSIQDIVDAEMKEVSNSVQVDTENPITLDQVNETLVFHDFPKISQLYDTTCSICLDTITSDNWITGNFTIFHPCIHIYHNTCSHGIKHAPTGLPGYGMISNISLVCPVCRGKSRQVNQETTNVRAISSAVNASFNSGDIFMSQYNPVSLFPQYNPVSSFRSRAGMPYNSSLYGIDDDDDSLYVPYNNEHIQGHIRPSIAAIQVQEQNIQEHKEEHKGQENSNIIATYCRFPTYLTPEHTDLRNVGRISITTHTNRSNIAISSIDLVIVLDISGSMNSVISDIKQEITRIIRAATGKDIRITIITFSSNAEHVIALQPITEQTVQSIINQVEAIFVLYTTNYTAAANTTLEVIREGYISERNMAIVFVSDGCADNPDTVKNDFTALNDFATEKAINIFSCSLGGNITAHAMQQVLTETTIDKYTHFASSGEFGSFIDTLLNNSTRLVATNIKISGNNIQFVEGSQLEETQIREGDSIMVMFDDSQNEHDITITYINTDGETIIIHPSLVEVEYSADIIATIVFNQISIKLRNIINEHRSTLASLYALKRECDVKKELLATKYTDLITNINNLIATHNVTSDHTVSNRISSSIGRSVSGVSRTMSGR